ncbi:peptidoglycan D,D-transpeptidase FtsI family protein [Cellvibrio japonicus]|uniref:Peptidoglycan D,D-transpeptidase FtsI n=1 Tax=Cellvibrio japonicus (strain Ueda107) TaxID=498211 RepID=B3PCM6_CELJU|nr:penicillin-binding protein 2 [Cellvibrio japonicus]ACE84015.1 penicillin-binding protein 3 - Pseudomonas aeruginosa [Cellvibrio japonicus Ueda107]
MKPSAFEPRSARPAAPVKNKPLRVARWRFYAVGMAMAAMVVALIAHVASLQVLPNADRGYQFLQDQGESRTLRTEVIPAYRGVITDRNGEPLAVSTPVSTLWANPKVLAAAVDRIPELAKALEQNPADLKARLERYSKKEFMYLKRGLAPQAAQTVLALDIPGVYEQVEYHRYYPAADVAAHLVGRTDVDDRGQEGMELAYDAWLTGENGAKEVLKDLRGRTVKELRLVKAARSGQNLALSIDLRLQYLAHRELRKALEAAGAKAGSIVILDVLTGEVLAMSNLPSYNPNDRSRNWGEGIRNRAITDLYEPGSTVKPWVVLAALETGKFKASDVIDTSPGYMMVGTKAIKDHQNYGALDMAMAIAKSSNIAMTKIAFALEPGTLRGMFARLGIGQPIGTGFPGEAVGSLPLFKASQRIERANMSYGYALNITALQAVQAYAVIASGGIKRPVSLLRVDTPPVGERVVAEDYTQQVQDMLKRVVTAEGTGRRAQAISYSVAGKTGTAFKAIGGSYAAQKQIGSFIGMAPADDPRIVAMVVIDEPAGTGVFGNGGYVAAPAFSKVAEDALRMLKVAPDNAKESESALASRKAAGDTAPAKPVPAANKAGSAT